MSLRKTTSQTNYNQTTQIAYDSASENKLRNSAAYNKCQKIIKLLKKLPQAEPFSIPVDPVKLKCFDYFKVIKHPMDLQTV